MSDDDASSNVDAAPVALVTGASRGVGKAIASRLRADGYHVAGTARDTGRLDPAIVDLPLAMDVTDPAVVQAGVDAVIARFGRLDALINNAGAAGPTPLDSPPGENDEAWHQIIAVNVTGPYYLAKAAIPHLPDGRGRIVTVASVLGLVGVPDQPAYCTAKHGVIGFSRSLAMVLAPRRITVNVIAPGWVDTEMAARRFEDLGVTKEKVARRVPIGRIMAPDDVAAWTAMLLRPESSGMTGQVLTLDGGTHQH